MPLVAVIVDAPLVSEVSSPETDTLATEPSDEVHVTDAPVIGWAAASSTVTPTVAVSPSDTNSSVSALSTTEAAAWLTMIGATDCADPLLAMTSAEPSLTAVTRPAESTVARALAQRLPWQQSVDSGLARVLTTLTSGLRADAGSAAQNPGAALPGGAQPLPAGIRQAIEQLAALFDSDPRARARVMGMRRAG